MASVDYPEIINTIIRDGGFLTIVYQNKLNDERSYKRAKFRLEDDYRLYNIGNSFRKEVCGEKFLAIYINRKLHEEWAIFRDVSLRMEFTFEELLNLTLSMDILTTLYLQHHIGEDVLINKETLAQLSNSTPSSDEIDLHL